LNNELSECMNRLTIPLHYNTKLHSLLIQNLSRNSSFSVSLFYLNLDEIYFLKVSFRYKQYSICSFLSMGWGRAQIRNQFAVIHFTTKYSRFRAKNGPHTLIWENASVSQWRKRGKWYHWSSRLSNHKSNSIELYCIYSGYSLLYFQTQTLNFECFRSVVNEMNKRLLHSSAYVWHNQVILIRREPNAK